MAMWNWLDWTIAAILVVSIVTAMMKGFTRELISLASLVVGLIVAAWYYPRAAIWFEDLAKSHEVALGLGFLTIFLIVMVAGAIISVLARKLIKTAGVQWFDRFLGGIFGLLRGIVVACVLLMIMMAFAIKPEVVGQSQLAPYVTAGARVLVLVMPGDLKNQFREGFEKFRQALIENDKKVLKK